MAKKRSKKDKVRAKMQIVSVAPKTKPASQASSTISTSSTSYLQDIFNYDPKLILKDLRKTFFVVLFILLILFAVATLYT